VIADGTDEDGARAARMDEWETRENAAPRCFYPHLFVRGLVPKDLRSGGSPMFELFGRGFPRPHIP
jgi:hypothetical protein